MKTTTDRMGSFISAQIIAVQDIAEFSISNGKCTILPKTGKSFSILNITKNGVDADATCSTLISGQIFTISIKIELKEFEKISFNSFNKYLALLELPTGETHVFGTPEFPLTAIIENKYSKTPAGKQSSVLTMTGKQPNNVLILN